MAELDAITEALRRQKRDLEDLIESTSSRGDEAADLVAKIENLRRRAEETQRRFDASVRESDKRKR